MTYTYYVDYEARRAQVDIEATNEEEAQEQLGFLLTTFDPSDANVSGQITILHVEEVDA